MNEQTNNQLDGQKMNQMVTIKKATNIPQGLILRYGTFL